MDLIFSRLFITCARKLGEAKERTQLRIRAFTVSAMNKLNKNGAERFLWYV